MIDGTRSNRGHDPGAGPRARRAADAGWHALPLVALSDDRPRRQARTTRSPRSRSRHAPRAAPACRPAPTRSSSRSPPTAGGSYAANEDAGQRLDHRSVEGEDARHADVGTEPEGVTVSPDGRWVYVTAETSNTILRHRRAARASVVSTFLVDARPRSTAFSPNGRFAYATSEIGGTIARVDARRIASSRGRIGTGEEKPVGVAVSPDGQHLYVTTGAGHALAQLDAVRSTRGGARRSAAALGSRALARWRVSPTPPTD